MRSRWTKWALLIYIAVFFCGFEWSNNLLDKIDNLWFFRNTEKQQKDADFLHLTQVTRAASPAGLQNPPPDTKGNSNPLHPLFLCYTHVITYRCVQSHHTQTCKNARSPSSPNPSDTHSLTIQLRDRLSDDVDRFHRATQNKCPLKEKINHWQDVCSGGLSRASCSIPEALSMTFSQTLKATRTPRDVRPGCTISNYSVLTKPGRNSN